MMYTIDKTGAFETSLSFFFSIAKRCGPPKMPWNWIKYWVAHCKHCNSIKRLCGLVAIKFHANEFRSTPFNANKTRKHKQRSALVIIFGKHQWSLTWSHLFSVCVFFFFACSARSAHANRATCEKTNWFRSENKHLVAYFICSAHHAVRPISFFTCP